MGKLWSLPLRILLQRTTKPTLGSSPYPAYGHPSRDTQLGCFFAFNAVFRDVALYLHTYGELPDNFITKNEARERSLGQVTPTQDNVRSAVLVSSVTFGLGHLLNLVNGSGAGLAENLFQVTGAIAIGFCF